MLEATLQWIGILFRDEENYSFRIELIWAQQYWSLSQCRDLYLLLFYLPTCYYFRDPVFLHHAKTEVHVRQSTTGRRLNVFVLMASSENIATKVNQYH